MYVVLHARNWYSQNHRYIIIYPQGIWLPKNNQEDYPRQSIGDIILMMKDSPKTLPFCTMMMQQKKKSTRFPTFHKEVTPNANTESEWKCSTTRNNQHTSTIFKGGTCFASSDGEDTIVIIQNSSKRSALHTAYLGSYPIDYFFYKI